MCSILTTIYNLLYRVNLPLQALTHAKQKCTLTIFYSLHSLLHCVNPPLNFLKTTVTHVQHTCYILSKLYAILCKPFLEETVTHVQHTCYILAKHLCYTVWTIPQKNCDACTAHLLYFVKNFMLYCVNPSSKKLWRMYSTLAIFCQKLYAILCEPFLKTTVTHAQHMSKNAKMRMSRKTVPIHVLYSTHTCT